MEDWYDLPENFKTIEEYVTFSIQKIKELKEENRRLRDDAYKIRERKELRINTKNLDYITLTCDERNSLREIYMHTDKSLEEVL